VVLRSSSVYILVGRSSSVFILVFRNSSMNIWLFIEIKASKDAVSNKGLQIQRKKF
jgi:hypothetical protein